ncbi:DUF6510 family protein [Microbacterium sp. NPDC057407]|uniref:DUF6510 family protein n=1 Tax=Microbacterium sp. NPDC057407 TaxID=3346120 RepID=UPI00366C82CC
MRRDISTATVDGNALAGVMADVVDGDITLLIATCAGCGEAAPLAEAVVEIDETAAIVRCRSCTHTLMTVLADPGGVRMVFGALRELRRP